MGLPSFVRVAVSVLGAALLLPVAGGVASAAPSQKVIASDSPNWAGYALLAADRSKVTFVSGTWAVPSVDCGASHGAMSIWVGIDGYRGGKLVQAGSQAICQPSGGKPTYNIFWEQLPKRATVGEAVKPGDVVKVSIRYRPHENKNVVAIWVNGYLKKTVTQQNTGLRLKSAECIVEAPMDSKGAVLPLLKFQQVKFSDCVAATNYGLAGSPIASGARAPFSVNRIDMRGSSGLKALTGMPNAKGVDWMVGWRNHK